MRAGVESVASPAVTMGPHLVSSHERKRLRVSSEATVGLVRVPQPPIGCGTVPGACSLRKTRRSRHTA